MLGVLRQCDGCSGTEERVFTDSWTGISLCLSCLYGHDIVGRTTMSPASEGDNFKEVLKSEGLMEDEEEDED